MYIIYIKSKFGPWGFHIHMYEIKRMEWVLNGHVVMLDTYTMYLI